MKQMDYTVGGAGASRTFTPLSERAKRRTPEPVTFNELERAREYMKAAQAEGYRFSGANLIDPEQKLVKNGYFVKGNDGKLIPAGSDWEVSFVDGHLERRAEASLLPRCVLA